jgi:hypothetical protein
LRQGLFDMPSVYDQAADVVIPVVKSSSGRRDGLAYRAYLDRLNDQGSPLPDDAGSGFLKDLTDAEEALRLCDRDVERRMSKMAYARHMIDSEHMDVRDLSPEDRHRHVEFIGAEDRWERAVEAAERARRRHYSWRKCSATSPTRRHSGSPKAGSGE